MKRGSEPAVLLLSPGAIKPSDADFGLPHLVSLGGYLEQQTGVRVEIVDLGYEAQERAGLERTLRGLGPYRLIGVSCYSSFDCLRVLALARWLRVLFPGVPLVAGGYHATALPEDLVFEGSPFDAVVAGEAEEGLRQIVERGIREPVVRAAPVEDLDSLPPYRWDLLRRYWPRAHALGGKLQLYLGRGCPYRCTFCMERAKGEHRWRAFSVARAVEELRRLDRVTPLREWLVNVADPLFGFDRAWRREVLEALVREGLLARQYWTLTRTDDLDSEDVSLLARARFSVGVGLESGSPEMLARMRKAANPGQYLERIERFAGLAAEQGLHWGANLVVGHPGETPRTMEETRAFCERLFTSRPTTTGWLSVDPFRLYPGSQVLEHRAEYERECGTRFWHPDWWRSWTQAPFLSEQVDPSRELDYATRVRALYAGYAPLVREISRRFQGTGTAAVDAVFARSVSEQVDQLSDPVRDRLLAYADAARAPQPVVALHVPVGLRVRDERRRAQERAVLQCVDHAILRSPRLIEALLSVELDGAPLPIAVYAHALEALAPEPGQRARVLLGSEREMGRLLGCILGAKAVSRRFGPADLLWLGAAMPRFPAQASIALEEGRRAVAILGPRFRPQDLVLVTKVGGRHAERVLTRVEAPLAKGRWGWTP